MLSSKPPRAGFDWNRIEIGRGRIAVLGALGWLDHHSKAAPARQELNLRAGPGRPKQGFPLRLFGGAAGNGRWALAARFWRFGGHVDNLRRPTRGANDPVARSPNCDRPRRQKRSRAVTS
jgi:hypothetical protein